MRHIMFAGAALAAVLAAPTAVFAQTDSGMAMSTLMAMTPEQQSMMAGWPADRQTMFKAWPSDYQGYYWTLSPDQQTGYWALTDAQRGQIQALTPEQRVAAWRSIQAQMAGQMSGQTAATMPAGEMPMARTMPSAPTGAYPVCSATVQDSCQNRGEGGAPGVSRASDTKGGPPAYHSSMRKRRHR